MQVLNAQPLFSHHYHHHHHPTIRPLPTPRILVADNSRAAGWAAVQTEVRCHGRFSCLFSFSGGSSNSKKEKARKALEDALEGKKSEFQKWDREIEKRMEMGGGDSSGRGGWFGGGSWFYWFNDGHFWAEAQQSLLTILGIVLLFLLLTKGNMMFALVFNSLLFVLRGTRNWFSFVTELHLKGSPWPATDRLNQNGITENRKTAKDSVMSKWRTDL